jgi:hypothetical protein
MFSVVHVYFLSFGQSAWNILMFKKCVMI